MDTRTLLSLAAVAWLAWYALSCWIFPFRRCWVCSGFGRHSRKDGKVFRGCWWCKQTGRRLRYGRRMANYWRQKT